MPDSTIARGESRPTEGFSTALLSAHPDRPVRMFLPSDYQPKYAYPLVVLFHAAGADEDVAARLIPNLSRRNYVAACLRGPVSLGPGSTGRPRFGWDAPEPQADAGRPYSESSRNRARLDEYLLATVAHACREYHVHSERIYLIGLGEGAATAYLLGLALAGKVAGIVALNGRMPAPANRPLSRLKAVRGLRAFIGHGVNNPVVSVSAARRDSRLLHSAGVDVRFATYQTTHGIHPDMLRDVNRWIMEAVTDLDSTSPNG